MAPNTENSQTNLEKSVSDEKKPFEGEIEIWDFYSTNEKNLFYQIDGEKDLKSKTRAGRRSENLRMQEVIQDLLKKQVLLPYKEISGGTLTPTAPQIQVPISPPMKQQRSPSKRKRTMSSRYKEFEMGDEASVAKRVKKHQGTPMGTPIQEKTTDDPLMKIIKNAFEMKGKELTPFNVMKLLT